MSDEVYLLPLAHPNKSGLWGITILVRVVERRKMIGRCEVLVVPVSGSGSVWVTENRLQTVEEQ